MIKRNWKFLLTVGLMILIFPVLITFVVSNMNQNDKKEEVRSGKIIEVDNGKYSITMEMEDYIPCVLMAQMPIDSPQEVLKAQAVVIRTYILRKMGKEEVITSGELGLPYISYEKLRDMWFREYRIEHSKEIGGMLGNLTGLGGSRIFEHNKDYLNNIMEKTQMKVLKNNGELILPLFHEVSNGNTRSGKDILGKDYTYLKSIKCDTDLQEKDFLGMKYITIEELREKLSKNDIVIYKEQKELLSSDNMDLQNIISMIDCTNKDKQGYSLNIKIGDTQIRSEDFAKALDLNSTSIEICEYEKGIRITTKGIGHGFGMSFAYAGQLAKNGMQWQQILKTFYDATISDY